MSPPDINHALAVAAAGKGNVHEGGDGEQLTRYSPDKVNFFHLVATQYFSFAFCFVFGCV